MISSVWSYNWWLFLMNKSTQRLLFIFYVTTLKNEIEMIVQRRFVNQRSLLSRRTDERRKGLCLSWWPVSRGDGGLFSSASREGVGGYVSSNVPCLAFNWGRWGSIESFNKREIIVQLAWYQSTCWSSAWPPSAPSWWWWPCWRPRPTSISVSIRR